MVSVRRGWGCPVQDIAGSSQLQWTQRRAWLSPSAKVMAPWGKSIQEMTKNATQVEGKGEKE